LQAVEIEDILKNAAKAEKDLVLLFRKLIEAL